MEYAVDLLDKLCSGPVIGMHLNGNDLQMTEIAGMAGLDYVWIDTEHTMIDRRYLQEHLIAARASRIPAFVRIPWNDYVLAKPILEYGPDGVIFPMVSSPEEARAAVSHCLYPPLGKRGFGPKRANAFGNISTEEYLEEIAPRLIKVVQLETRDAVQAADEIAAVPDVDIIAIGPVDMSFDYGLPGQVDHEIMKEAYAAVFAAAHRQGKYAMVSHGVAGKAAVEKWLNLGADLVTLGSDYGFVASGARQLVSDFREAIKKVERFSSANDT